MSKRSEWGMAHLSRTSVNYGRPASSTAISEGASRDASTALEEATFWLSRLEKGLTEKQAKGLRGWLAAAPLNRQMFFEMAELYDDLNAISGWARRTSQAEQESTRQAPLRLL